MGLECNPQMKDKNDQIGFRLSEGLKNELQAVAKREARTLSQICEMFLIQGLEAYKKEGPKYLYRYLARQKKQEGSSG